MMMMIMIVIVIMNKYEQIWTHMNSMDFYLVPVWEGTTGITPYSWRFLRHRPPPHLHGGVSPAALTFIKHQSTIASVQHRQQMPTIIWYNLIISDEQPQPQIWWYDGAWWRASLVSFRLCKSSLLRSSWLWRNCQVLLWILVVLCAVEHVVTLLKPYWCFNSSGTFIYELKGKSCWRRGSVSPQDLYCLNILLESISRSHNSLEQLKQRAIYAK